MDNAAHELMIDTMMRKELRISDDPAHHTEFMVLGARYADRWLKEGGVIRTHERAVLRLTRTSQEWLEARYSFNRRIREIGNELSSR